MALHLNGGNLINLKDKDTDFNIHRPMIILELNERLIYRLPTLYKILDIDLFLIQFLYCTYFNGTDTS